jgi:hypothetical protein
MKNAKAKRANEVMIDQNAHTFSNQVSPMPRVRSGIKLTLLQNVSETSETSIRLYERPCLGQASSLHSSIIYDTIFTESIFSLEW